MVLSDYVFSFFSSFLMCLQERVEFFCYVFFAFATKYFACFASAFAFRYFGIVFFEEEEVVLEYAADCWVGAFFALFRRGAFASCEGIPNLLFYDVWLVHGEYACFGLGRAHFSAWAEAWEEAAVDLCGFVVAEFLGYVACYSPIGVLVDCCRYEGGYVFACEFFVKETWCGLDGWPEDPPDVSAVLEAKGAAGGGVSYTFGYFECNVVE